MIYVGIDIEKGKHDCFIINSDGFDEFYQKISSVTEDLINVKVGLEATGHYSYNLLGFLFYKGLTIFVINQLHINLYRKRLNLRQTKTEKVDAHTIVYMHMSDVNLKSFCLVNAKIKFPDSLTYDRRLPGVYLITEIKVH